MVLFLRRNPQKYSNRFCQLWSTWSRKEYSIGISSVRTFYSTKIGTWNLWTSVLPPRKLIKTLAGHSVGLPPIPHQNSSPSPSIRLKLLMFGAWVSLFTPCSKEPCPSMENNSKTQKRISFNSSTTLRLPCLQTPSKFYKWFSSKILKGQPSKTFKIQVSWRTHQTSWRTS